MPIDPTLLWNEVPADATPMNDKSHLLLLDQYKLYVELADRVSQRRATANSYFLSLNSAIIAFVGYLTSKETSEFLWLLAIAGATLALLWQFSVKAYSDLNAVKWTVVHEIEKRLPISPYNAEWDSVGRGTNFKLYRPVSHIEAIVPWIFLSLHIIVFIRFFPWTPTCAWLLERVTG